MTDHHTSQEAFQQANELTSSYFTDAGHTAETFEDINTLTIDAVQVAEKVQPTLIDAVQTRRELIAQGFRNLNFLAHSEVRGLLRGAGVIGVGLSTTALLAACVQEAPSESPSPKADKTGNAAPAETEKFAIAPLSAEQYPNAATLVPAWITQESNFYSAGATLENAAKVKTDASGKTRDGIIADAAKSYESNLIVSGFNPDSDLGTYVQTQEKAQQQAVEVYFVQVNNGDSEPYYVRAETVVPNSIQVLTEDGQKIVAKVTIVGSDNSAENDYSKYVSGAVDTTPTAIQYTFTNIKGYWKLSDVTYES